jgi:Protein of unknown function (DUF456)
VARPTAQDRRRACVVAAGRRRARRDRVLCGTGTGLVLGFVLGIWLAERIRLGPGRAWPSTKEALAAVGLSILVEFAAALTIAAIWALGLLAT